MARVDQLFNYLQTPGLTDAQIAAEIGRLGVTAQEVSQLTGVPVADVQSRLAAVPAPAPAPAPAPTPADGLLNYLQTPGLTDQQIAAEIGRLGVTAQEVSQLTGVPVDQVQQRLANPVAQVVLPGPQLPGTPTPVQPRPVTPVQPRPVTPQVPSNLLEFQNYLQTPGLTDAQILAEMGRLGITNRETSNITGVPVANVENRVNALSSTMPFANATQGFAQRFNNYTSIAPGAQFTTGGQSPYSQIMSQMSPVGNPYATARAGLPMGGYDPGIYDPNLLQNFIDKRAAELRAAGMPVPLGFDGGGDGAAAGDGAGSAAGDGGPGGAADGGSGPGDGPGTGAGWYMGGLIDRVSGVNPSGPDDGQINAQVGEYVVKKSSVNKYGKGLLDMINEGKIPAKKIKSLLD